MLFTEYLNILHHLQAMKMVFFKLFLIRMFKNPNLGIYLQIWRGKKLNSAEFMEFVFSKSGRGCWPIVVMTLQ